MAQPYQDSIHHVPANTKQEQTLDAEEKHREALQMPECEDLRSLLRSDIGHCTGGKDLTIHRELEELD